MLGRRKDSDQDEYLPGTDECDDDDDDSGDTGTYFQGESEDSNDDTPSQRDSATFAPLTQDSDLSPGSSFTDTSSDHVDIETQADVNAIVQNEEANLDDEYAPTSSPQSPSRSPRKSPQPRSFSAKPVNNQNESDTESDDDILDLCTPSESENENTSHYTDSKRSSSKSRRSSKAKSNIPPDLPIMHPPSYTNLLIFSTFL